jgi:hypothetical protein
MAMVPAMLSGAVFRRADDFTPGEDRRERFRAAASSRGAAAGKGPRREAKPRIRDAAFGSRAALNSTFPEASRARRPVIRAEQDARERRRNAAGARPGNRFMLAV